jgi:hypothetical protein
MRSRLFRQFGSIVGLLAIVMTTLAPTVSQALASNARFDALLAVYCSAALHARQHIPAPSHQTGLDHWETCGYCNLVAHTPVLPPLRSSNPALAAGHARPPVPPAQPAAPYAPLFSAQPRAPPSFA